MKWPLGELRALTLVLVFSWTQCNTVQSVGAAPRTTPAVENSIVAFLKDADRQSETDKQRREIERGLRDMLEKSPEQLRRLRYADYQGRSKRWSIIELLKHYFVPNPMVDLDERRFFRDFRAPEARAVIENQLDNVRRALD